MDKTMANDKENLEKDDLDIKPDEVEDEGIKKALETEIARKKHFREKFQKETEAREKAEAKIKELEDALQKGKAEPLSSDAKKTETDPEILKKLSRLELGQKGYSSDEIEFLEKVGGESALSNEYVKTAIDQMRAKKKSEEATPEHSSGSPVYKKFTQEELERMSTKQLEEVIRKMQA